jgi:hypothetical protein
VYFVVAGLAMLIVVVVLARFSAPRTRGAGCCAPADPRRDLRMRAAFEDPVRAAGED